MKKIMYPIAIGTMALSLLGGCQRSSTEEIRDIYQEIEKLEKSQLRLERRVEDLETRTDDAETRVEDLEFGRDYILDEDVDIGDRFPKFDTYQKFD